jgi:hypothetical protein
MQARYAFYRNEYLSQINWCTASQFVSSEESGEAGRVEAIDVDAALLHAFDAVRSTSLQKGFHVFTFGQSSRTDCANACAMEDMLAHLEKLRVQIAECELIRDLATDSVKRELFNRLAEHYKVLAGEVERAITASKKS